MAPWPVSHLLAWLAEHADTLGEEDVEMVGGAGSNEPLRFSLGWILSRWARSGSTRSCWRPAGLYAVETEAVTEDRSFWKRNVERHNQDNGCWHLHFLVEIFLSYGKFFGDGVQQGSLYLALDLLSCFKIIAHCPTFMYCFYVKGYVHIHESILKQ